MMKRLFFLFIGALTLCGLSSCDIDNENDKEDQQERHERKW